MTIFDNLLAVAVIAIIAIMFYLKWKKQTFKELIIDIKEGFQAKTPSQVASEAAASVRYAN